MNWVQTRPAAIRQWVEEMPVEARLPFLQERYAALARPYAETMGQLPIDAGSPRFMEFVQTRPSAVRQQVEELPLEAQLPFLKKRFAALGPRGRGDFSTATLAPPARRLRRGR